MTRFGGPSGRALGLAGAGIAALVASRGFGTPALATFGAGLVALPILVGALVWLAAVGMSVERRIEPARCVVGESVRVRIAIDGWAARLGLDRILNVAVDPAVGAAAIRGGSRRERSGSAWAIVAARGDHHLEPARVTVADPFGLARRVRVATGDERLLVVPLAPGLDSAPLGARAHGRGLRRRSSGAGFGELDRVRDYQAGDALSRVHWAQTAKRGRLQTKEMRSAEGAGRTVLVLLDGAVPAGAAFETTVTCAAALARHFLAKRDPVSLVLTGRHPARLAAAHCAWPVAEVALARVEPGGDRSLALALVAEAGATDAPDLIVAITSGADAGLAGGVGRARALGIRVTAVLSGPAATSAGDLSALGAEVVVVPGPDRVVAALEGSGERARVA